MNIVDWNTESCNKPQDHVATNFIVFLKFNDIHMCQFLDRTTHHRALQTPTLIDWVIANDEDLIFYIPLFSSWIKSP